MHEFSIASQIWESVARAARQRGGRVLSITLELGELNLLEEEQLRFWINELAARDSSPDVELKITLVRSRVHCPDCGQESEPALPEGELDHHLPLTLTCPHCGSRNVTVTAGREITVASAEIETEQAGRER